MRVIMKKKSNTKAITDTPTPATSTTIPTTVLAPRSKRSSPPSNENLRAAGAPSDPPPLVRRSSRLFSSSGQASSTLDSSKSNSQITSPEKGSVDRTATLKLPQSRTRQRTSVIPRRSRNQSSSNAIAPTSNTAVDIMEVAAPPKTFPTDAIGPLPGREEEFNMLASKLTDAITSRQGCCICTLFTAPFVCLVI